VLIVGRITRAHGLQGEVVVDLLGEESRLVPGTELHTAGGVLTIVAARPHQERWVVTFDGVQGREAAEALRGTELLAEPLDDRDALWLHDLLGATAVDTTGEVLGTISGVLPNPADDLLELADGGLVPVTFVLGWEGDDPASRRLVVDPPAGLLSEET
jgi:16S rRNA processing protein RimM